MNKARHLNKWLCDNLDAQIERDREAGVPDNNIWDTRGRVKVGYISKHYGRPVTRREIDYAIDWAIYGQICH